MATRGNVIEGQVMLRSAILALETITQEDIEAGERGITRRLHIILQANDARNAHGKRWRGNDVIVFRHDIHAFKKHRLDRILPGPERERIVAERAIIRVQNQRGQATGRDGSGCHGNSQGRTSFRATPKKGEMALHAELRFSSKRRASMWAQQRRSNLMKTVRRCADKSSFCESKYRHQPMWIM